MPIGPDVPVVIVGAGPVGVTAALLLARRGVRSVLLERHRDVYPLPRALVVDDEVRRILQAAGVGEEFAAIARPGNGLRLLDARHRVMAEFRRAGHGPHGYPQTSMFEQPRLERLLRAELARRPECELRGGAEVTAVGPDTAGPVRVAYRDDDGEHELWAEAVLGCDGANSLTRAAVGAVWEDLRFEESWTVVDVRTPADVRSWDGVDQVCDPELPATFMRVGEDRYRWEFRQRAGAQRPLRELIAPWLPLSYDGEFEVVRETPYTFRARIADRWCAGRVFLLGDAAHLTPPFIGQGLCAGLRDAYNLSWKLARVLRQGGDERLLDTYESERRPHARHVIRLAVAMGWAMTGGQDGAAPLRRRLLAAACRIPGLTTLAGRGLSPPLTPGPLVRRATARRSLAGTYCPQPWVYADGGAGGSAEGDPGGSAETSPGGSAEASPGGSAEASPGGSAEASPGGSADGFAGLAEGSALLADGTGVLAEGSAGSGGGVAGLAGGSAGPAGGVAGLAEGSAGLAGGSAGPVGGVAGLADGTGVLAEGSAGSGGGVAGLAGGSAGPADSSAGPAEGSAGLADRCRIRLDEVLGDSFVILTAADGPGPALTALARGLGVRAVPVGAFRDDGTLAAWLRAGRADAVLLRPDRVVLDVVPAGGRAFTDTAAWAALLHTTPSPSPRSATR
ncbi:bifunctional 3-(3-hydroxy-phenyl)propionate/3-hydroxycinnamic acid hydroxylase [Streptomyces sp. NPDC004237]|uniref:bifunctional 3-(3-hydroxy-phenyl)propionate/3-hydroxycinnamic acid hydroxylase n=1 Tax=Streptomyces sp. NPDC004237 TaxID=3154455 RepID=UPI00339F8F13